MHERYAYGALIFLLLLIPERRFRWLALALGVVFTLNCWPPPRPTPVVPDLAADRGLAGLAGSVAMIAITA